MGWVKCPYCGHKLFMTLDKEERSISIVNKKAEIEIKCSSCKRLVYVSV